jgi:butyryl-CoA dehydrogenase
MDKLAEEQEVMGAIADMVMEVFAMESAILRADNIAVRRKGGAEVPIAMARIYSESAIEKIELAARKVISAAAEGDTARIQLTIVRRLAKHERADTVALRRQVARHVVKAGRYAL